MRRYTDTIVIGGGIIGSAIAYFLSKSGQKVTLVEKKDICSGTSCKCDGNIQAGDSQPGFDSAFVQMGIAMFDQIQGELDIDFKWSRQGSLMIFEENEEEAAREYAAAQIEQGLPMTIMNRSEVHDFEPLLSDVVAGGIFTACDGRVNPMLMTFALVEGAKRHGAKICLNTEVNTIIRQSNSFSVITDSGCFNAEKIINAAGIWSPAVGKMIGLDIPVIPRQGQILVSEQAVLPKVTITEFGYLMTKYSKAFKRNGATDDMERFGVAMVCEPTEAGNMLLGSSRRFSGYDTKNSHSVMKAIAQRACRYLPYLSHINMIRSYSGLRPYTEAHRAIISDTPVKGFYIAAGHEGGGITQSLITGRLMTDLVCGLQPCIEPEPLSFKRFMQS